MQRTTLGALCAFVTALSAAVASHSVQAATAAETRAQQACVALAQVRGLRVPLSTVMPGDSDSIKEITLRAGQLVRGPLASLASSPTDPITVRIQRNAELLQARQDIVGKAHEALRSIRAASPKLLNEAEDLVSQELKDDSSLGRISAVGQLLMLTQRIGKSAAEMITVKSMDPESVFLLGKDTKSFTVLATALRDGSKDLRLSPAKTAAQKQRITALMQAFERTAQDSAAALSNLKDLVAAQEAQAQLRADTLAIDRALEPICMPRQAVD